MRGRYQDLGFRLLPCADVMVEKRTDTAMNDWKRLKKKTAPKSEPQVACNCQNFATFVP